jgi:peptidoglycan/LPS O-acetylase OafA/YrhL
MTRGGTAQSSQGTAYRPEIDGLRALAVMLVIFSHAQVPWLAGGYLGVDIFFVISGYLITGILVRDLEAGRFSCARFYLRRIRRILPALLLVMFLTLPFALWLMLPDDLQLYGQSLVATAAFANNFLLTLAGSYWGPDVQFFPLMHSWSLSVEEQFYLVVPLLMWAAWRIGGRRGLIGVLVLIAGLSFWSAMSLNQTRANWSFYLIVPRAWELCAGALVALGEARVRPLAPARVAMALTALGIAVALAIVIITPYGIPPGRRTLVLVAGICMALMFGSAQGPAGRLLTLRPVLWTGLISYSLYLFHQPVFAFLRLSTLERPSVWAHLALIAPIFLLAWLAWRHVEQPFRDPRRIGTRTVLLATGGGTLAAILIGLALFKGAGNQALRPAYASYDAIGRAPNSAYNIRPNAYLDVRLPEHSERMRVLVVGDSFARDFINMGTEVGAFARHDLSLMPINACAAWSPAFMANVRHADIVVVAYRLQDVTLRCVVRLAQAVEERSDARVIVLGGKQFGWNNSAAMRVAEPARFALRVPPLPAALAANATARTLAPPGTFVDIHAMIADDRGRVPVFTPDRHFVAYDMEHLTPPGARWLGSVIFRDPALAALARGKPQ